MTSGLPYDDYQLIIENSGTECSIAEAHGVMTGMLCVDQSVSFFGWQNELNSSRILTGEFDVQGVEHLVALFDSTRDLMAAGGFGFSPCLPDDDVDISDRVRVLSEWCQGFLHGLGSADVEMSWPGECKEIIKDFIAISQVDSDSDSEDDEASLMELVEYVRVGVELIRTELLVVPLAAQSKPH
jgi:uncharacterized protein YgfB (UPF0149 family)